MSSFFRNYYHQDVDHLIQLLVPIGAKKTVVQSNFSSSQKYDYLVLPNTLAELEDVQDFIKSIRKNCHEDSRIVIIYYNFFWKPFLDLASLIGLRKKPKKEQNWLTPDDIFNILTLELFQETKRGKRFIFPIPIPIISDFVNKFIGQLPIINYFCLTTYQVFRPTSQFKDYSVSIIIPARNEEGTMKNVLQKIPRLGTKTEVIFVEGNSTDNTFRVLDKVVKSNKSKIAASLFKQSGKGKADAVRLGFDKAQNEMLFILDADLTVDPSDLSKFYFTLANGIADFANGSRLVYPMEGQAMRFLNYLGNKFFSTMFSYLLGFKIKDTLCGTKVLFRKDYQKIKQNRKYFGDFDPFGDFDLLFGATKLNLKIIDVPVRYKNRVYGETNISRFSHGLILLRMVIFAAFKLKYI